MLYSMKGANSIMNYKEYISINKKKFDKNDTNVTKGIAILLLLFHHLFLVYERLENNGLEITEEQFNGLYFYIISARICVWVFVFLSSYGLAQKYKCTDKEARSLSKFYLSSWWSLMKKWFIAYLLMVLIYVIQGGNLWEYYRCSKKNILLDIVEWNDFFGVDRFFGSWYICFAQILVLFIPIFVSIVEKYSIFSILILYVIMQFIPNGINSTGGGDYLVYVPTVFAGIAFSINGYLDKWVEWQREKDKRLLKTTTAISLVALCWIMLAMKYTSNIGKNIGSIYSMIAAVSICCVVCLSKLLRLPLLFLGRHSAEMFMVNVFFYIEMPQVVYLWKKPFVCYIVLVVMSVVFSMLSHFVAKVVHIVRKYITDKMSGNKSDKRNAISGG